MTDNPGEYAVVASASGTTTQTQTLNDKLIIAENGCFYVTGRKGQPPLLIFPAGTTISAHGNRRSCSTERACQENTAQAKPCIARGDVFRIIGSAG